MRRTRFRTSQFWRCAAVAVFRSFWSGSLIVVLSACSWLFSWPFPFVDRHLGVCRVDFRLCLLFYVFFEWSNIVIRIVWRACLKASFGHRGVFSRCLFSNWTVFNCGMPSRGEVLVGVLAYEHLVLILESEVLRFERAGVRRLLYLIFLLPLQISTWIQFRNAWNVVLCYSLCSVSEEFSVFNGSHLMHVLVLVCVWDSSTCSGRRSPYGCLLDLVYSLRS